MLQWEKGLKLTPEIHPELIFVFGSNCQGIHGKGAALEAKQKWGAVQLIGSGRMGNSYAIPTKIGPYPPSLYLEIINCFIDCFVTYSHLARPRDFLVTRVGCGLAGYRDEQIAPRFSQASRHCIMPIQWIDHLSTPGLFRYHDEGIYVGPTGLGKEELRRRKP